MERIDGVKGTGYRVLGTGYRVQGTGYRVGAKNNHYLIKSIASIQFNKKIF
jgi:hypothetical protein